MRDPFKEEIKQVAGELYKIALDYMDEEEARDLFISITKRGHGKRGFGRKPILEGKQGYVCVRYDRNSTRSPDRTGTPRLKPEHSPIDLFTFVRGKRG
jgi:hypothetical protein